MLNKAPDARLDIYARGFWERQRPAFFDVWVCHPNVDSYSDLIPKENLQEAREREEEGSMYLVCGKSNGG